MTSFIYRPIELKDLNDIFQLISETQHGLTSLMKDKTYLKQKIEKAIQSLKQKERRIKDQSYLFVLEDQHNKKVIGMSGIKASVGQEKPFYSYQIKSIKRASKQLNISKNVQLLILKKIKNGPSEIGSLVLDSKYRGQGLGRLLSLNRFMFIAAHPFRFKSKVIAEMRGVSTKTGESEFFNAVGHQFFNLDFKKADQLSATDKTFIKELFPRYPIYVQCLPKKAQDVIGKCHENTNPAKSLLINQGFQWKNDIDIFDGGPKMEIQREKIKIIKTIKKVKIVDFEKQINQKNSHVMANLKTQDFRVIKAPVQWVSKDEIICEKEIKDKLKINRNEFVLVSKSKGASC